MVTPEIRAAELASFIKLHDRAPTIVCAELDKIDIEEKVADAIRAAVTEEREVCAALAKNPYSDEVKAFGYDPPLAVGAKISAAIMARKS